MPMVVYGYGRVSTNKQEISPVVQEDACKKQFELWKALGKVPDDAVWGGFYQDKAVSGSVPFFQRPAGLMLMERMRSGDRIIVSNLDRAFRSVTDLCKTLEMLDNVGVSITILDIDVDTHTNMGRAFVKIMAVIKELEREEIGRRTREAIRKKKEHGEVYGSIQPIGWKKFRKKLIHCDKTRSDCEVAGQLHDQGMSVDEIFVKMRSLGMKNKRGNLYSRRTLSRMIKARNNGYPLPPWYIKRPEDEEKED